MKRAVVFFLSILALLPFLSSCEKETLLTVDQTSVSITDTGGSQTITLSANKPWSASSNQGWCKVSPSAGEEAASTRISITCDANTTYEARSATVTVTCAELTKSITVSQATNNGLLVSQTSYEVTKAAQQLNIQVQANVKFSVEVDSGCKDWVKYNSTKGLTTSTVVLDIAENKTYDNREGKVTIKQDGGSLSSTITIKQSQLDGLFMTTTDYNLSNEQHTLTVEVSTNVEFDVKPEADWVKYVQTKGLSTKQIVLEVAANDTYDQRETKVNVKQKNGDLSGVITIKQDEKYGILVSQPEYTLSNEAATINVEVKYNVDFEVVIPDDCKAWIKQVSTKSLNSKTYTFSIAKNETYENREGSITFKQKKGAISSTVSIKQAQMDYLNVEQNQYMVEAVGQTLTITVNSNVDFSVSVSDNWLHYIETKGVSSLGVVVSVDSNLKSTSNREGRVLITGAGERVSCEISIVQKGAEKGVYYTTKFGELDDILPSSQRDTITTIIIKGYLDSLDFMTLRQLPNLKYLDIYDAVCENDRIPSGAFNSVKASNWNTNKNYEESAAKLVHINFPKGLKAMGEYAFYHSETLIGQLILPNSLEFIDNAVFADCPLLYGQLVLPESLKHIGESAFQNCCFSGALNLPPNVEYVGDAAFRRCGSLTSLKLSNRLSYLGYEAFLLCNNLRGDLIMPGTLDYIQSRTFYGCGFDGKLVLSNGIRKIATEAFYQAGLNGNLVIPETVEEIGDYAFEACGFESITLPETVNKWGEGCFSFCGRIQGEVVLPNNMTKVPKNMFSSCSGITSIKFPKNLTIIGGGAFSFCGGLCGTLEIPEGVVLIESYAFSSSGAYSSTAKLEKIILPKSLQTIQQYGLQAGYDPIVVVKWDEPIPYTTGMLNYAASVQVPSASLSKYQNAEGWKYHSISGY